MSRIPGTAVATMSRVPERDHAPGDPLQASIVEVLEQGVVGRERPHRGVPGAPRCPRSRARARRSRWPGPICLQPPRPARSRPFSRPRWPRWRRRSSSLRRPCPPRSRLGRRRRTARAPCAECYEGPPRPADGRCRRARARERGVVRSSTPARSPSGGGKRGISVVQVEGLLDPPTASLLKQRDRATRTSSAARCS